MLHYSKQFCALKLVAVRGAQSLDPNELIKLNGMKDIGSNIRK